MNEDENEEALSPSAPLVEHLTELRTRLIRSIIAFFVAFFVSFYFAPPLLNILLLPFLKVAGEEKAHFIATHFLEQFFVHIKIGFFGGVILGFPLIAMQIYKFVAPGLYKREKKIFIPYLIATPVFFLFGMLVVYFIVIPLLLKFSLSLQQVDKTLPIRIEILPKVSEYLDLLLNLIIAFGLAFQLPIILTLLGHIGLLSSEDLKTKRRYAIVAITGMAAIITPPDLISMCALMLPVLLLYEASIFSVKYVEPRR